MAFFLQILKKANVTPIFKGSDKTDPNNYRPISILPTMSKIFERHVANQLKNFLEKTGVLYSHQSGFSEKHSCQTALIHLIDTWLTDIDKGNVIGSVFLDLRKAFDLVDHEMLLHKLKMYHFSDNSCKLFGSYLKDRFQMVKHGTMVSGMKPVLSGVPQGSILGPILFLLYVNDLPLNLSSRLDMYADDATLHKSSSCIRQIDTTLQDDVLEVQKWCVNNNMVLNANKTTCMLIGTKNRLRKTHNLDLKTSDSKIENVRTQKLLGVYIDSTLSWKIHVGKTCAKLSTKLHLLKRIKFFLTPEMQQTFYNSYITPYFDNGCVTWSQCKSTCISRITKLQKRAARIILNKPIRSFSKENFVSLKWLAFKTRCMYFTTLMVYKTINGLTPPYMSNLFNYVGTNSIRLDQKQIMKLHT